ncbi:MAG: hypothetical protein ACREVI_10220 [Steroidobacteraceae bacterium]
MKPDSRCLRTLILFAGLVLGHSAGIGAERAGFDHDHQAFESLLARHLRDGRVDYGGLKQDRAELASYARALAMVDEQALARFTRNEQLAYWLNAYNAFVLVTIVDMTPAGEVGGDLAGE